MTTMQILQQAAAALLMLNFKWHLKEDKITSCAYLKIIYSRVEKGQCKWYLNITTCLYCARLSMSVNPAATQWGLLHAISFNYITGVFPDSAAQMGCRNEELKSYRGYLMWGIMKKRACNNGICQAKGQNCMRRCRNHIFETQTFSLTAALHRGS